MRKIKKLKIKQNSSNDYSNYHYFIPNSENIKCADGSSVDDKIASLRTEIDALEPKTEYLMKKAPLIDMAEGSSLTLPGTADAALRKYKILGDSYQEVIAAEEGTTVEGEHITVNDYNVNKEETLSIGGNSYQATRSGKNLLNVFGVNDPITGETSANMTTVTPEGNLEIPSLGGNGNSSLFNYISVSPGDKITISYIILQGQGRTGIRLYDSTKTIINNSSVLIGTMNYNTYYQGYWATGPVTFSVPDGVSYIRFMTIGMDTGVTNILKQVQIEKNSTATEYEPYGVSPSPDYPSEVKNVGSNVNLFDGEVELGGYANDGAAYSSATRVRSKTKIYLKAGTYTVSCKSSTLIAIGLWNTDETFDKEVYTRTNDYLIFSIDEDKEVYLTVENTLLLESKIKLEKGSQATLYSDYNFGSNSINYTGKNLFNIKNISSTQGGGTSTTDNDALIITSTSTIGAQYAVYYLENVEVSKSYSFSCKGVKTAIGTDGAPLLRVAIYGLDSDGVYHTLYYKTYQTDLVEDTVYDFSIQNLTGYLSYRFFIYNNGGTPVTVGETTKYYDIQFEEGTSATAYEPYQCTSYTIPLEHEYCALPNGVRDTIEKVKGVWNRVQRVGTWWFDGVNPGHRMIGHNGIVGEYPSFYVDKSVMGEYETGERLTLCSHFIGNLWNNVNATACNAWWSATTSCGFRIHKSFLSNYSEATTDTEKIAAANNWLAEQYAAGTPVTVYYELATPVYTVLDDNIQEILNGAQNFNVNSTTLNVYSLNEISPHNTLHYNYVTPAPSPERPSEVRNVGDNKNLFDGVLESGLISGSTGQNGVNAEYIRCKNYIPVEELTEYHFSSPDYTGNALMIYEYTADYTYNQTTSTVLSLASALITKKNTKYLRFRPYSNTTSLNLKFKLEKGSKATNYTPYNYGDIELNTNAKNLFNEEGYINVDIKTNKRYELNLTDLTQTYLTISYSTYMVAPASDGSTKAQHFFAFYDKEGLTIKSGHFNVFNYEDTITHYEKQSIITIPDNAVKMMIDISPYVSSSKSPTIRYDWIQLEYGKYATEYIPYESNNYIFQTPDECCSLPNGVQDSIEKIDGVWNRVQRVQHISRAVADMNNSESYPGWTNITELLDDFAGHNTSLSNVATYIHNIGNNYSGDIGVNGGGSGILFLTAGVWGMTQTEWKTYYSNLIFNLYYEKPEPVYTPITDQNLINTLNQLEQDGTYYGDTNIYFEPTSENVSAQIKMIYKKDINALIADSGV